MARKPLSELSDWELVDEDQDLRGRKLVDTGGDPLGTIRDMIVDTETGYVEAVVLEDGTAYGAREFELRRGEAVLVDPAPSAAEGSAPRRGSPRTAAPAPHVTASHPRIADSDEAPAPGRAPREPRTDRRAAAERGAELAPEPALPPEPDPGAPAGRPQPTPHVLPDSPGGEGRTLVITLQGEELYVEKVPVVAGEIVVEKRAARYNERVSATVRREQVEVVVDEPSGTARPGAAGPVTDSPGPGAPAPRP